MKRIGFVDYDLENFHAKVSPKRALKGFMGL